MVYYIRLVLLGVSFTLWIFVSFQQKDMFKPIGVISKICFVFRVSVAKAGNW